MNLLIIFLLLTALSLTRVKKLSTSVNTMMAQSVMVALACIIIGLETGEIHIYIAALLTVIIKVWLIPYALKRIVVRLRHEKEENRLLSANHCSLAAILAIVLAYGLIDRTLPGIVTREALSAALALTLIGLLMIMTRQQAIMQIIGLITMENGLYLLGLSVTKGLPLIIELGIFFDVLVLIVVLVILTYRLKISFLSTDTSNLKKLKG